MQSLNLPCVVGYYRLSLCAHVHLNPGAPKRPSNMVFLRDLLQDFRDNEMMVGGGLRKVSIKHFCTLVNPITVCLTNIFEIQSSIYKGCGHPRAGVEENTY